MDRWARFEITDNSGRKLYLYKDGNFWCLANRGGLSEAFSNFTSDPMLFRFALEDAKDNEDIAKAIKAYINFRDFKVLGGL